MRDPLVHAASRHSARKRVAMPSAWEAQGRCRSSQEQPLGQSEVLSRRCYEDIEIPVAACGQGDMGDEPSAGQLVELQWKVGTLFCGAHELTRNDGTRKGAAIGLCDVDQ